MSRDFVDSLWGDGPYGELRAIRTEDGSRQQFFERDYDRLVGLAHDFDRQGYDAYIGVLPRIREGGKAEDCPTTTRTFWLDADGKLYDGDKVKALMQLLRADLSPSILVDSGNGYHAYWLLREAVPFTQAATAMKGLAKQLGGDHVYDAPRVLRLPGTNNHKSKPPRPVRLLVFDPLRRYRFADFDAYSWSTLNQRPHIYHGGKAGLNGEHQAYADLPEDLRSLIEAGVPRPQRSEAIFGVYCQLIERNWTEEEIAELMLRQAPLGIGEKVSEMSEKAADRWMRRTYERALEAVG